MTSSVFSPSFSTSVLSYSSQVIGSITCIVLTISRTSSVSTVTVNNVPVNGDSITVSLQVGGNVLNIVCTAQDGVTSTTYVLTVSRGSFVVPDRTTYEVLWYLDLIFIIFLLKIYFVNY